MSESFDLTELTDENKDHALQIVLIDGMTGIVHALKLIGLPYTMSKRFEELVEKQRKTQIQDFDTVLNKIYSKYNTDALVEEAETYFCNYSAYQKQLIDIDFYVIGTSYY